MLSSSELEKFFFGFSSLVQCNKECMLNPSGFSGTALYTGM